MVAYRVSAFWLYACITASLPLCHGGKHCLKSFIKNTFSSFNHISLFVNVFQWLKIRFLLEGMVIQEMKKSHGAKSQNQHWYFFLGQKLLCCCSGLLLLCNIRMLCKRFSPFVKTYYHKYSRILSRVFRFVWGFFCMDNKFSPETV